jgi:hypothetical protein
LALAGRHVRDRVRGRRPEPVVPVFDHFAGSFVDAFVKRAEAIHG